MKGLEEIEGFAKPDLHEKIYIKDVAFLSVQDETVKDEMKEFSLSLDAKMTTMGMEGTIKVNFECDFIAFDNDVVITPPEGYLYFTEK